MTWIMQDDATTLPPNAVIEDGTTEERGTQQVSLHPSKDGATEERGTQHVSLHPTLS